MTERDVRDARALELEEPVEERPAQIEVDEDDVLARPREGRPPGSRWSSTCPPDRRRS